MARFRNFMLLCLCALMAVPAMRADNLTIIAVNDTHSQIDPTSDNLGGVARRRAIYDQLRAQNPNTVLIHAGDAVQGTLYFSIYRGDVEYALMDTLGYDAIILGNHEFDNGMEELAAHYRNVDAVKISANYDFSATPLDGLFQPYWIKAVGDKRVAFFGININPVGLIAETNCENLRYINAPDVADAMARYARAEDMKSRLGLRAIRRKNATGYHYFIANLSPNDIDDRLPLAIGFKDAVWFNPLNGDITPATISGDSIDICLRSGESMILQTFNEKGTGLESMLYVLGSPNPTIPLAPPIEINKGWTLSFIESAPQVDSQYAIDTLRTWEGLDDTTAHLMGTGVYECDFKLSRKNVKFKNNDWVIDLGDVRESARVYINDVKIGCAWAVPYTLVFPGNLLQKGKNHIRIEVTNLPANRIAQMDREGVKWRKMNEINVVDINYKNTTYDGWAPVPSGLNSKVTIAPIKDGYDF